MNPCAEFVRPGLFVPLFFLFLWLAVSSAPRTHRDVRSLSAFQKIYQFPASLSGLSGPMVASHSCVSSWQGRMRRRTIEPAISSDQGTTSEHRISFSCYRGRFRSRAIRLYHPFIILQDPAPSAALREGSLGHAGSGCQLGDVVINQQIASGSPLPYLTGTDAQGRNPPDPASHSRMPG